MVKRFLAICMAVLIASFASGCALKANENDADDKQVTNYEMSDQTPQSGGMLRLAMCGVTSLNPLLMQDENNISVMKLLYDGLFTRTAQDAVENVLCESYVVSPNGQNYEFYLKDGVTFHNGAKLMAADVEASLAFLMESSVFYQNRFAAIDTYHAEGKKLVVTLHEPVINLAALFDFPVVSKRDLEDNYNALTYTPNGTGRYKMQSYKQSKELYLTVNENYHLPFSPNIQNVQVYLLKNVETAVTMLENMQIDLLPSGVIRLHEYTPKRNLSFMEFSSGKYTFIGVNNQRPALLSPITRSALSAALNKEAILSSCQISYAKAADLPIPVGSYWNNGQLEQVLDKQQVVTRLAEDGWRDADSNGIFEKDVYGELTELCPEILVNGDNPTRVKIAEAVKQAWNAVGVPATVTSVSYEEYMERIQDKNYDVFIGSVQISENYDLSFLFKTDANLCGVSIEEIDRLLVLLARQDAETQKQQLYHELCDVLRQNMPVIGLCFEQDVLVFDEKLQGNIMPSGADLFYGIENWFLAA